MITASEKNGTFLQNIQESLKNIKGDSPEWMLNWQRQHLSLVEKQGFPTLKDEEWKYLNVKPIIERTYSLTAEAAVSRTEELKRYCDASEINVVFVNGIFSPELSNLKNIPQGIKILTIKEALRLKEAGLQEFMTASETSHETAFTSLAKALAKNGVYIEVADKAVSTQLIHIIYVAGAPDVLTTPYNIIRVGKSAQASVLESFVGFGKTVYFTNALTEITIKEDATLKYCKAQSESLDAYHIGATRVRQERNSNFIGFSFAVGGLITRNNLEVTLNGEGASATLNGLYCVNGQQIVDNHTLVDHREPNCTSNQLYKGILNGAGRAVFNGKIFVQPIAQKTNSYQLNKNLLLGKDAQVNTKPQLEIGADDVKCTHGATIGQLNEDEIFYLQSRSISRKDAVTMLSHGFVDGIVETIHNESIARKLNQLLEPTFAAL